MMFTTLGGLIGGVITIFTMYIRHYFIRDSKKLDEGAQIRIELRKRCMDLEKKIDLQTEENERWRVKYFTDTQKQQEIILTLKQDLASVTVQLQDIKERFIPKRHKESYL